MKEALRKEVMAIRMAQNQIEIETKSRDITDEVISLPEFKRAKNVMLYMDFRNEVSTDALIKHCLAEGKRVFVPITDVANKKLTPSELLHYPEDLTSGTWGILEPKQDCVRPVDPLEIDLVIVPGVAYDLEMNRLGYGGGFYDRFLPRTKSETIFVALAFELQIVDTVFPGKHDISMDYIVTESCIIQKKIN